MYMRVASEEEVEKENKLLDEWWEGLDYIQKHRVISAVSDMRELPDRRYLCLRDYKTDKKDEHGTNYYATCLNVKPCKDHENP
jgi:hypothetical protein